MKIFTKNELIQKLQQIREQGWIKNVRYGNHGSVGNLLEDLLEIEENNLPIPNASEWELKCQRSNTTSLTTLFHIEPSPQALKFVPNILLPKYGWLHKKAGIKYSSNEMSFRQTISTVCYSDRGFRVVVDDESMKVLISFDAQMVSEKHLNWLNEVKQKVGLKELFPQPYWGFKDLFHKAGTKLRNCFFVKAETRKEKDVEYFRYEEIIMLWNFSFKKFINCIKEGVLLVDFDARSGHNHGTKFRFRKNRLPELYENIEFL